MKSNQGSYAKRALLAGLIAGGGILAASAYAVTADRSGDMPRCEARHLQKVEADWEGGRAARLAGLKAKLALTAEQGAAWNAFAAAVQSGPRHQS